MAASDSKLKILYIHGMESGPNDVKFTALDSHSGWKTIEHYKPDIIIAASWGGFVTMELIQRGYWNGKTILLAPAYVQCMRWLHYKEMPSKRNELMTVNSSCALKHKILVIHSDTDRLVDCNDSNLLCSLNDNFMHLQIIPNDDHILSNTAQSGELVRIVQQYLT
eukprot:503582_1